MRRLSSGMLSLLPFLEHRPGSFSLDFPLVANDPPAIASSFFPFRLLSDADPVARLLLARVETDGGSLLAPLFVLVQKDRYRLAGGASASVTNLCVEKAWMRAMAAYREEGGGGPARLFGGQVGERGTLVPFASLFFCKETKRFFHPPCPRCGRALSLCTDDQVLRAAGAALYSASLERYLYCGECGGPPKGALYAREVAGGASPSVRDLASLLRAYATVPAGSSAATGFPCGACPARDACFGPRLAVLERVVPFSFYPFFAFAFGKMSLCVPDFLFLLSGASPGWLAQRLEEQGEGGRAATVREAGKGGRAEGLLFCGEERAVPEILYLKLCLLEDLVRCLPRGERMPDDPDAVASLDRAWVALGAARDVMPRYWNFRTALFDVGRFLGEDVSAAAPGRADLLVLGAWWFEALVANAIQDRAAVRSELLRLLRDRGAQGGRFPGAAGAGAPFSPENLAFEPSGGAATREFAALWEEVLSAGWTLLCAGAGVGPVPTAGGVAEDIARLRAKAKDLLFGGAPPSSVEAVAPRVPFGQPGADQPAPLPFSPAQQPPGPFTFEGVSQADARIVRILDLIAAKWGAAAPRKEKDHFAPPPEGAPGLPPPDAGRPAGTGAQEEFVVRTVILGGRPEAPPAAGADGGQKPRPAGEASTASDLEKTMVLGRQEPPLPEAAARTGGRAAEADLEKTVILGRKEPSPAPGGAVESLPGPFEPAAPREVSGSSRPGPSAQAPSAAGPLPKEPADFLDKTIVLSPGAAKGPAAVPPAPQEKAPPPAEEEVDLEKTVVIKKPPPSGGGRRSR